MSETVITSVEISESSDLKSCRIDKKLGIIYDVKVLTEHGNRSYPQSTRQHAVKLLEGAKVNINHAHKIGNREVKLEDRFGKLMDVRDYPDGTRANLHYDITDPRARKVEYFAEKMPELLGFSIHGKGNCSPIPGTLRETCDEIVSIQSVDLVADAGSTKSLFESQEMEPAVDPLVAIIADITALKSEVAALKAVPVTESKDESKVNLELQSQIDVLTMERDCRVLCESMDVKADEVMLKALSRLDTDDERRSFVMSVKRKQVSQAPRSGSTATLSESVIVETEAQRLDRLAALAR